MFCKHFRLKSFSLARYEISVQTLLTFARQQKLPKALLSVERVAYCVKGFTTKFTKGTKEVKSKSLIADYTDLTDLLEPQLVLRSELLRRVVSPQRTTEKNLTANGRELTLIRLRCIPPRRKDAKTSGFAEIGIF